MRIFIILLAFLPFLFSCSSVNDNKVNDTKDKGVTDVQDVEISTEVEAQEVDDNNSIQDEASPFETSIKSKLISKSGAKAKAPSEKDEEAVLKAKRARTNFTNGTTYYKNGDLYKAIEAFQTSLEYKADNAKAFYNLGKIYYELGQKDLSLSYYEDAIRVKPNDSLSLMGVGVLYYEKGDMKEALKYYNKALELAPNFSGVYFNRGTMFGQNGQYKASIEDLSLAIKYDKDNSEAYINRGLAYFYTKDLENACKDWQKAKQMGNKKGDEAVKFYCEKKK